MPRKPNTLCAGTCGRKIWPNYKSGNRPMCRECRGPGLVVICAGVCGKALQSGGTGCLPPGERICRACRKLAASRPCSEPGCGRTQSIKGLCKTHYNETFKDPERERARTRIRTHRRKDWSRLTDITPEYEMGLRATAKRCPLCDVKLIDEPYQPNSKELDHIVPRGVGGTHTIGNVRILCRACNVARPYDGSDYSGPVTLWAEVA